MTKYLPAAASLPHPGPYHVAQRLQEPLVVLDVLGFVLGVASRVDHPARLAAHGPEMLLPGILGEKRRWIKRGARGLGFKTTLGRRNEGRKGLRQQKSRLECLVWWECRKRSAAFCLFAELSGLRSVKSLAGYKERGIWNEPRSRWRGETLRQQRKTTPRKQRQTMQNFLPVLLKKKKKKTKQQHFHSSECREGEKRNRAPVVQQVVQH